jgi:hypothetical protein
MMGRYYERVNIPSETDEAREMLIDKAAKFTADTSDNK